MVSSKGMNIRAADTDIESYVSSGWWEESKTLSDVVRENALKEPNGVAFRTDSETLTWKQYNEWASGISEKLKAI